MNVNDFVKKAKEVEKLPSLYQLGKFGNSKKGKYYLWDCSGLIKGILWGYPNNGKYKSNGVPDINANTIITKCKEVSTNFKSITVGEYVWLDGHCGIYIGDGKVIESSPIWEDGVQVTRLNQRNWRKHGFLPWVDYVGTTSNKKTNEQIANEVIQGKWGNGATRKKKLKESGYDYSAIQSIVNKKLGA